MRNPRYPIAYTDQEWQAETQRLGLDEPGAHPRLPEPVGLEPRASWLDTVSATLLRWRDEYLEALQWTDGQVAVFWWAVGFAVACAWLYESYLLLVKIGVWQ